jgi:hypothetical protein
MAVFTKTFEDSAIKVMYLPKLSLMIILARRTSRTDEGSAFKKITGTVAYSNWEER